MSKVNNIDASVLNNYTDQNWNDLLAKKAYRGYKINKLAKKPDSCTYDQATHQLQYVSTKGTITVVSLRELLQPSSSSLSHACHRLKMKCSKSYSAKFNERIANLTAVITKASAPNTTTNSVADSKSRSSSASSSSSSSESGKVASSSTSKTASVESSSSQESVSDKPKAPTVASGSNRDAVNDQPDDLSKLVKAKTNQRLAKNLDIDEQVALNRAESKRQREKENEIGSTFFHTEGILAIINKVQQDQTGIAESGSWSSSSD